MDELFFKIDKLFFKIDELFSKSMNFFSKLMNSFSKSMNCFSKLMIFFKFGELISKLMNSFPIWWTFFNFCELFSKFDDLKNGWRFPNLWTFLKSRFFFFFSDFFVLSLHLFSKVNDWPVCQLVNRDRTNSPGGSRSSEGPGGASLASDWAWSPHGPAHDSAAVSASSLSWCLKRQLGAPPHPQVHKEKVQTLKNIHHFEINI